MASLRHTLGKRGKEKNQGVRNKRKKGAQVIDLNKSDADSNSDDFERDETLLGNELTYVNKLKHQLSQCARCGPRKYCKINKFSKHCEISWQKIRAWAIAWVFFNFFLFSCSHVLTLGLRHLWC
jgi:hypothetical protein